jgi:hypothetical protein
VLQCALGGTSKPAAALLFLNPEMSSREAGTFGTRAHYIELINPFKIGGLKTREHALRDVVSSSNEGDSTRLLVFGGCIMTPEIE